MIVELTQDGVKAFINWDNVLWAGHLSEQDSSNGTETRVRIWYAGNVTFYIDETYDEMKKIVLQAENKK